MFRKLQYTLFLALFSFVLQVTSSVLQNHGIYKIENKHDSGVLTMSDPNSDSTKVLLMPFIDAGTQKWRAKRPGRVLSKTYEFKPTSNEEIELTGDGTSIHVHGMVTSSNGKYWHVRSVGENSFELKNYLTDTCLASQGLNSSVVLSPCTNTPQQEWVLKEL